MVLTGILLIERLNIIIAVTRSPPLAVFKRSITLAATIELTLLNPGT